MKGETMKRTIKYTVTAARWFDRQNGNTYNSARIERVRDGAVLLVPFGYGYEDHYRQRALEAMAAAKWLPPKYRGRHPNGAPLCGSYEMENGYPIFWSVSDGLKRDCVALGEP